MIDIGNGIFKLSEHKKLDIRTDIKRVLERCAEPKVNLTPENELRELSRFDDNFITKADKDGAVVVLDKEDYQIITKILRRLVEPRSAKARRVENEINNLVKREISKHKENKHWKVSNPEIPRL